VFERHRRPLLAAVLLAATGRLEREGLVIHLIAHSLEDRTLELRVLTEPDIPAMPIIPNPVLAAPSRNFR
jgi:error-prone DNA polymerase